MQRIKCVVKYDGSNFAGYAIQKQERTIQNEIQEVLKRITKEDITIYGSGRTDAKVHANGQVIHFDTNLDISIVQWKKAINSYLPKDIHVMSVEKVSNNFHARFSAIEKKYVYIVSSDEYNPLERNYVYQLCDFINVKKMQQAAKLFVGEHDFRNFCANEENEVESFVRNIKSIDIITKSKRIYFVFRGNGFLRYMVRNIVGTFLAIAQEKISEDDIKQRLDSTSRNIIPFRAPAEGLYLDEVSYKPDYIHVSENYHTHTYRCLHANGSDEEYVISAIKNGYKVLGFSDHMMVPGVDNDVWTRGKFSEFPGYVKSIRDLKEKYKDQIEIHVGMECEYFPELHDFLYNLLKDGTLDYLIYGNHCRNFDGKEFNGYWGYAKTDDDVIEYTSLAIAALRSGLFTYFAHPDLFMTSIKEWSPICEDCARQICEVAKELDIPLEINQGGIRYTIEAGWDIEKRYKYPYFRFWEIAKEVGNKVVTGVDAHNPKDFNHTATRLAEEFAKKVGIKITEHIEIKKIK